MKKTTSLENINKYFIPLAHCHLMSFGVIYLDEYGQPMEIEEVIEMLESE